MTLWILFGFLFVCQAQLRTNDNDWAQWADWKQWLASQNSGTGTSENQKTPYWNNYGNWKQWAEHAQGGGGNTSPYGVGGGEGGSPWSSTPYGGGGNKSPHGTAGGGNRSPYGESGNGGNSSPYASGSRTDGTGVPPSKENFDNWRKWNLQKESLYGDAWQSYGRWQTWAEKNGEGDYAAYVGFEEWNNRDKMQPQEAFDADTIVLAATHGNDGHGSKHDDHGSKHHDDHGSKHDDHDGRKRGHDDHDGRKREHDDHEGSKHGHQAKQSEELNLRHRASEDKEASRKAVDDKNAKESFEQWIKRNKYVTDKERSSKDKGRHGSGHKNSATHHEEVTEKAYEHRTARADQHESDQARASDSASTSDKMDWQSYAQGWQKYIPGSGGNAQSSTSDYSAGAGAGAGGGDWQQYMPASGGSSSASAGGGGMDWQQYMPSSGKFGEGTTDKSGHYSEGGDWSKYVPEAFRSSIDKGVMGGPKGGPPQTAMAITPETLVSPGEAANELPEPGYGLKDSPNGGNSQIDWRKYVPAAYLHFIPDDKAMQAQNAMYNAANNPHPQAEHPQEARSHKSEVPPQHDNRPVIVEYEIHPRDKHDVHKHPDGSEYAWRDTIPAPYRENVPTKETIEKLKEEQKKENKGHEHPPSLMNAAALYQSEQATSYSMGWIAIGLCLIITILAYAYKKYSKRLEYDNLKDTRIARGEATDVDHLLLI